MLLTTQSSIRLLCQERWLCGCIWRLPTKSSRRKCVGATVIVQTWVPHKAALCLSATWTIDVYVPGP
ncbi:hypothetical protein QR685DRAFT_539599 [Neurospora intermedia]|uniref:Uncharacterized protein n=1 Tax=Neurospora intermedia TaxID=5142 RepID=A0ABR3D010_NEUIN